MQHPEDPAESAPIWVVERLRAAGLRPTRQRILLGELLFGGHDRHVTAESLHEDVVRADAHVSLATVYNTLNQFTSAGLLRSVAVDGARPVRAPFGGGLQPAAASTKMPAIIADETRRT